MVTCVRLRFHALGLAGTGADLEANERVEDVLRKARQADAFLYLFRQAFLLTVVVFFNLLD